MPRFELHDPFGTRYCLDTLDYSKVGPWFTEWVPRLAALAPGMPPLRLVVWPLDDGTGNPDWPFKPDKHDFDREGAADLILSLRTLFGISEDLPSEHDPASG